MLAMDSDRLPLRKRKDVPHGAVRDVPLRQSVEQPWLPAKAPELNPVENIWQYMRDNWISNRIFASYGDILDHCCEAWNKLTDRPWLIMSIGLRDWAHRF